MAKTKSLLTEREKLATAGLGAGAIVMATAPVGFSTLGPIGGLAAFAGGLGLMIKSTTYGFGPESETHSKKKLSGVF